jgi:hypothetical protein
MHPRARIEVIQALRHAASQLRADASLPVETAPQETALGGPALFQFISSTAAQIKAYEEMNPERFMGFVQSIPTLLEIVLDRKFYDLAPGYEGALRPETYAAFTVFDKCLKAMTTTLIDPMTFMGPFVQQAMPKHWAEVDMNNDLYAVHYKTPGTVEYVLDMNQLKPLVEAAQSQPGAIQLTVSALAEKGIRWEPIVNNEVNNHIFLDNIQADWGAVIPVTLVAQTLVARLAIVEVDSISQDLGWWDAARASQDIPKSILTLIRGGSNRIMVRKEQAQEIAHWAGLLPGWKGSNPGASTPLRLRAATMDDILV